MNRIYIKITWLTLIIIVVLVFTSQAQLTQPVKWSYASKRISAKEAIVYMKATMEKGWHINSIHQPDGGPLKTTFKFTGSKTYSLIAKVTEPKSKKKFEKVFGIDVLYFEDSVVFSQKIKLLGNKPVVIKGKVEFMACTTDKCLPPAELAFAIPVE